MEPALTGLYIYPVKSARGIARREVRLTDRGLEHDRRFLLVDPTGRFITQREERALARLETRIVGDELVLGFEGRSLALPLQPTRGTRRSVRVFQDEVEALDLGAEVGSFVSSVLGREAALVYMPDDVERRVDPSRARVGDIVSFADGFPYLLANEASLAALNRELSQPVPMARFRPNFVVSGLPAYAEDDFRALTLGSVRFLALKPCSRCVIVNTDQSTGLRAPGPLEGLVRSHLLHNKPMFGQNLVACDRGSLRLGDRLEVHALD